MVNPLTKAEIQVLRNALYMHREYARAQERIAREGKRDIVAEGHSFSIRFTLKLDSKLSDMEHKAPR